MSISFVIVVNRDRLYRTCVLALFLVILLLLRLLTSQHESETSEERTRAKTLRAATRRRSLCGSALSLSRRTAIFIYDVNKPLSGRITSAVAVCALLGHDGCDAPAMAAQLQRSGRERSRAAAARYKSRTRAQIYDVAGSLSWLPSRLLHRRWHSTLSLAMLYSCRECFIAGIFILCSHTHTHTRAHSDSAHSLRAKADDGQSRAREKEQLFLCQTYASVVVGGKERKKEREVIKLGRRTGLSEAAAS